MSLQRQSFHPNELFLVSQSAGLTSSRYLESVDLHTAAPTAAQLAQIQTLTKNLQDDQDAFNTESDNAYTRYLADPHAQAAKQGFGSWVTQHDPAYLAAQKKMQIANSALESYEISVYGPSYRTLTIQRDKIDNQARDELSLEPGYVFPFKLLNFLC